MIDGFFISIDVSCSGDYVPAVPSRYNAAHGNWLPGECAHIENFKVFIVKDDQKIEITNHLTKKQLNELETDYLIHIESGEDVA